MNNEVWRESNRPSRNENMVEIKSPMDESNIIIDIVEDISSAVDDQYQLII